MPITPDCTIAIEGQGFEGGSLAITLDAQPLAPDASASGPGKLVLKLPSTTAVGQHFLEIATTVAIGGRQQKIGSAGAAITVSPRIVAVVANRQVGRVTITATIFPPVRIGQKVLVKLTHLVSQEELSRPWQEPGGAGPNDSFTDISADFPTSTAGDYLVRVAIDNVQSRPEFKDGAFTPQVAL